MERWLFFFFVDSAIAKGSMAPPKLRPQQQRQDGEMTSFFFQIKKRRKKKKRNNERKNRTTDAVSDRTGSETHGPLLCGVSRATFQFLFRFVCLFFSQNCSYRVPLPFADRTATAPASARNETRRRTLFITKASAGKSTGSLRSVVDPSADRRKTENGVAVPSTRHQRCRIEGVTDLQSRTADGEAHGDVGPAALAVVLP